MTTTAQNQTGVGAPDSTPTAQTLAAAISDILLARQVPPTYTPKNLIRFELSQATAVADAELRVAGTGFLIVPDPVKYAGGFASGSYIKLDSVGSASIPVPNVPLDSAGTMVGYPLMFLAGVPFSRIFYTNTTVAATKGAAIIVFTDSMTDSVRVGG